MGFGCRTTRPISAIERVVDQRVGVFDKSPSGGRHQPPVGYDLTSRHVFVSTPGITWRVSAFSHQATTFRTASVYRDGVNLRKHTEVLGDAGDARVSKPRRSTKAPSLTNNLVTGRLASVSALKRRHSRKPMTHAHANRHHHRQPTDAPSAVRWKSTARCSRWSGELCL